MDAKNDIGYDVSVIIPTYNGLPELSEQLDSLAAQQTDVAWEVIVADNASTDNTVAFLEERAKSFPVPLRVLDARRRQGAAHARNAGILAARAEKIGFCDADDRVGPQWVAAVARSLDEFDVVGGPIRELLVPFSPDAPKLSYSSYTQTSRGGEVSSGNMAVWRNLVIEVGGFDESLLAYGGEDLDLGIRLSLRGVSAGYDEDLLLYFRATSDIRVRLRKLFQSGRTEVLIWRRYPDLFAARLARRSAIREIVLLPLDAINTLRAAGGGRAARLILTRLGQARQRLQPDDPTRLLIADHAR